MIELHLNNDKILCHSKPNQLFIIFNRLILYSMQTKKVNRYCTQQVIGRLYSTIGIIWIPAQQNAKHQNQDDLVSMVVTDKVMAGHIVSVKNTIRIIKSQLNIKSENIFLQVESQCLLLKLKTGYSLHPAQCATVTTPSLKYLDEI